MVQIATARAPDGQNFLGPFQDTNGNLYLLSVQGSNPGRLEAWKSTNDGATWASQDLTANKPLNTNVFHTVAAVFDSAALHVVTITNVYSPAMGVFATDVEYHQFRTSDNASPDTWTRQNELISSPDVGGDDIETYLAADIAVRSNGDLVVIHPAGHVTDMGSDYVTVGWSKWNGSTWNTNNLIFDPAQTPNAAIGSAASAVLGTADRVHFFYTSGNPATRIGVARTKTLSSGDVLNRALNDFGLLWHNGGAAAGRPSIFPDGSDTFLVAPSRDTTGLAYATRLLEFGNGLTVGVAAVNLGTGASKADTWETSQHAFATDTGYRLTVKATELLVAFAGVNGTSWDAGTTLQTGGTFEGPLGATEYVESISGDTVLGYLWANSEIINFATLLIAAGGNFVDADADAATVFAAEAVAVVNTQGDADAGTVLAAEAAGGVTRAATAEAATVFTSSADIETTSSAKAATVFTASANPGAVIVEGPRFGTITATVVKRGPGALDRHNNPTVVNLYTIELRNCSLQQRGSDETLTHRESTETSWILIGPAPNRPELVTTVDLVRIDAQAARVEPDAGQTFATFELEGNPDFLRHAPTGGRHHLELALRRVRL